MKVNMFVTFTTENNEFIAVECDSAESARSLVWELNKATDISKPNIVGYLTESEKKIAKTISFVDMCWWLANSAVS